MFDKFWLKSRCWAARRPIGHTVGLVGRERGGWRPGVLAACGGLVASLVFGATVPSQAAALPQSAWTQSVMQTMGLHNYLDATDAAGDVYVAGYANTTCLGVATPSNGLDFLAKYNPAGQLVWSNTGNGFSSGQIGLALDSSGNVYATRMGAVEKFSPSGSLLWSSSNVNASLVAVAPSGTIYVAGENITDHAFVSALNPSGSVLWTQTPQNAPNVSMPSAIAVDPSGNVVVTGDNTYSITLNEVNGFVAKYSPQGNVAFNLQLGASNANSGYTNGVAIDSTGSILVGGEGPSLFGESISAGYGYVLKYDPSGTLQWVNRYQNLNGDNVATDAAGNVYVRTRSTLAQYSPSGVQLAPTVNLTSNPAYTDLAWSNGNVYIADVLSGASFNGTINKMVCDNYWNVDSNGAWSSAANWSGAAPNAIGAVADFYNNVTASRTATVDSPVTIGMMVFSSSQSFTVSGANAITLQGSAGSAAISDLAGTHLVAAPLALAGSTAVTVANAGDTLTLGAPINGNGSLTKFGSGALVLSGSNTYAGPTTVDQGQLVVNGSLTGAATVNGGGILSGTGSLGGVTVNAGGQLAPGSPLGGLYLGGNLVLEPGAAMDYELDRPGTSDEIFMSTAMLSLSGQEFSDFHFAWTGNFGPGTYDLIAFGSSSGSLGTSASGTIDGYSASLAVSGNNLLLSVVPEPSSLALLCVGGIGLLCFAAKGRKRGLGRKHANC